jgi:hypothetical protein
MTLRDFERARRYDWLVDALESGDLPPQVFRRRARRMAPIAGRRVEYDPAVALAVRLGVASEDWVFESPRSRARRGRRS